MEPVGMTVFSWFVENVVVWFAILVVIVAMLGFISFLVCAFFIEAKEEKQRADADKFHEEMEAVIKKQLPEIIEQAIAKSVEIIREEQKKKE
jgi:hypothetical protein